MQIALPLMISTNGYGVLFDMYCPMVFDDSGDGYGYEKGDHMITDIRWSDNLKELDISEARKRDEFKINII